MNLKVQSTDYIYVLKDICIRVIIEVDDNDTALFTFYKNGNLIYYKKIKDMSQHYTMDFQLIDDTVEQLRADENRWIASKESDVIWLIDNYNKLISTKRIGKYLFSVPGVEDMTLKLKFIEDNADGVSVSIQGGDSEIVSMVEMKVGDGINIIPKLSEYASLLEGLIMVFRHQENQKRTEAFIS